MPVQPWPEPHPERGPAMSKQDIAGYLGVAGKDTVEAWITRTRQGTAVVPFPASDGRALPQERAEYHPNGLPYWWRATVDTFQRERTRKVGRASLTVETIHRVQRLHVDGEPQARIATICGVSTATVSRIINGKIRADPPSGPTDAVERAQTLAGELPTAGRWLNE